MLKIRRNQHLKISENLLFLEKGRDELLLANCANLRPLYIRRGRKYVANFLNAAAGLGTYERITGAFPGDENLLNALLEKQIIVPHMLKESGPRNYSPEGPELCNKAGTSLYLLVSQSCNMGCVYCLNGRKTYRTDKGLKMNEEVAFRGVERCLEDLSARGRLEIVFFGGEPMLNWTLTKNTIDYCERILKKRHPQKEIRYHITSNLSLLPPDLIEWSKRFKITFLCNIDGPAEIHDLSRPFKDGRGSHKTIVDNIKRLVDAGVTVDLRATITVLNHDRLLEVSKHHKAIGGNSSAFIPVNPVNSDEDTIGASYIPSPRKILRGMLEIYRNGVWKCEELYPFNMYASRLRPGVMNVLGCGLPLGNTPVIDVRGDVFPCIYLVGIKKFFMGNVMNDSYPDRELLKRLYDCLHIDCMEECKSCPWRYICGGGCALSRLTVSNNPGASKKVKTYCEQIRCVYTKKLMESILWDKARAEASNFLETHARGESRDNIIHC